MYLYSRRLTLTGSPRHTMPWATRVTEHVNSVAPFRVSCWTVSFGQPVGTLSWSARLESQQELADGTTHLMSDATYLDLIDEIAPHVAGPATDELGEIVHGAPQGDVPPIGAIATVTRGTMLLDQMPAAMEWAVTTAQHVESVTGHPVMVGTSVFGQMGDVVWLTVSPDRATAEDARSKLMADAGYQTRLADTGRLFVQSSGTTSQLVRIA